MNKLRTQEYLIPEDPLILENLKVLQDTSSQERVLLPCQEDNVAHTFNNCLTTMVFIIKDERERAERILDFFANAMDQNNTNPYLQNFYCMGEARGFFQNVLLRNENDVKAYHTAGFTDRWMGDMAWMIIAYLFYEKKYGFDKKPSYLKIKRALVDLLKSFYTDDPNGDGGYIQHGWRWGSVEIRSAVERLMNQSLSLSDMVARYRTFSKH